MHVSDAAVLPDLLGPIPKVKAIGAVGADGASDTRRCQDAIAARGAQAIVPPRKNARPWKPDTPGAKARNNPPYASMYLCCALWRRLTGYHRRSLAETNMSCVKLLGEKLKARDFDCQTQNCMSASRSSTASPRSVPPSRGPSHSLKRRHGPCSSQQLCATTRLCMRFEEVDTAHLDRRLAAYRLSVAGLRRRRRSPHQESAV